MPVTYAERFRIERDSRLDPASLELPADTNQADVAAAVTLRRRVRSALVDIAEAQLSVSPIPDAGPAREAIPWARDLAASPDPATDLALRLLLARFGETFTAAQVIAPAVTDDAIRTALVSLVPPLALGAITRR